MHPDHPWFTKQAVAILSSFLKPEHVGLEFGSGKSTVWFAQRVCSLTSVEDNQHYFNLVKKKLEEKSLHNVNLIYFNRTDYLPDEQVNSFLRLFDRFQKNSLDFILVDGFWRAGCASLGGQYIRPGGILVLDNANWYLPHQTFSPSSRSLEDGPTNEQWARFLQEVKGWRCIWTSSGVSDTAIYIKPC